MADKVPKEIQRARISMQFDHPFFGYLALTLEPVEVPNMVPATMGTDGIHLFYHPEFVKKTPIAQLTGVIAHEIMHIVLRHLSRAQGREEKRWNVAADLAVNPLVLQEFQLIDGILNDPKYHDKSAEFIYSNLPMQSGSGSGSGQNTLDSHEQWKNWGKGDKGKDGQDANGQDTDGGSALDQEWANRVAMAATQARVKGKFPANMESIVGELLQPKLDWKALLQDRISSCAKNDFRLTPANKKHLYRGFYLPSIAGEQINIACGIDDSGSISQEEVKEFLSEVKGICDSYDEYTIHLLIGDAALHQRIELHPFDQMPKVVVGGGGTDFRPIIEAAEKLDITSLVFFTDAEGTFPDKEPIIPVIWILTPNHGEVPWGSVIEFPRNDTRRR